MKSKNNSLVDSCSPSHKQRRAGIAKRKQLPIEDPQRPWGAPLAGPFDEVRAEDLCKAFARDIGVFAEIAVHPPGVLLTRQSLGKLPNRPAVYWLVAPPDADHRNWHLVFVDHTQDLYKCWNAKNRGSIYQLGLVAKCVLDWKVVEEGAEALVAEAIIYRFKPLWNLI